MTAFEAIEFRANKPDPRLIVEGALHGNGTCCAVAIRPRWYATPAGADGKADHSPLEQVLRLASAVVCRQVVLE